MEERERGMGDEERQGERRMERDTRGVAEGKRRHERANCHPQGIGGVTLSPKEGEITTKEALKEELTKALTVSMENKLKATKDGWVEVVKKNIKEEAKEEAKKGEVLIVHTTLEEDIVARSFIKKVFETCFETF